MRSIEHNAVFVVSVTNLVVLASIMADGDWSLLVYDL